MRLPRRRRADTFFPSASPIGGTAVRSRNGLSRRTLEQAGAKDAALEAFEVDGDVGELWHSETRPVG